MPDAVDSGANAPAINCGNGQVQRAGQRFKNINGEILSTVFHAGEMLVGDARFGGQLLLGKLLLFAEFANKTPDGRFGIHFAHS